MYNLIKGEKMNQEYSMYIMVIIGCLFAISEALSVIPAVKANGIFQAIFNILKALVAKKE